MKRYIIWLILLAIIELVLSLYLTYWKESFWNSISNREQLQFLQQLGIFTIVAVVIGFVSGLSGYLISLTAIKWRGILNAKAVAKINMVCTTCKGSGQDVQRPDSWMCYDCKGSGVHESRIENISQRVQEDCTAYPDLVLNLGWLSVKAIIYVIVFSVALVYSFSVWYLLILLGYTIMGTIVTRYIAHPLVHLNYENQRAEASYRHELTVGKFEDCIRIMLGLAKKQKHLTYFQQFYGQVGVVIPLIIIAPVYFSTGMTLGLLMRFNSIGNTIIDNMNMGVNSFASINKLLSCRRRLREINVI